MHRKFQEVAEKLHPKFEALLCCPPVSGGKLPKVMPHSGIYLFSEGSNHLYVGRTRRMRGRYGDHSRSSAKHNDAPFAFKLAREQTGYLKSEYKPGKHSRIGLSQDPIFDAAFKTALLRIRAMDFRYVEETDPTAQCLLEVYASVVLGTRYNDFDTH
ncbi:hypothetical protein ABIA24_000915 [Sinorhizobium fredii]|uniref:hypothetical protein n=1 Tax=Rhizobium fredii TaxID=380 RepID=UPI003512B1A5